MKSWLRLMTTCATTAALALAAVQSPVRSEDRLLNVQLKDGSEVHAAFRDVVRQINPSVVSILVDGRQVSLGVIVSSDGYILTKASELGERVRCRLHSGQEIDAAIAGAHGRYDVALLKIEAAKLPSAKWSDGRDPQVGQWLATPGMQELPVAVGIVSVPRRSIAPEKGALGAQLERGPVGARIINIVPNSAASRAGLKTGDVIIKAAGERISDTQTFDRLIHKLAPGDTLNLVVVRENRELTLRAILGRSYSGHMTRDYYRDRMIIGRMSQRRAGFPQAIQHDTVLEPEMCGGPVVDLSGLAVGMNIARAGRVETYAVPADVVKRLIRELRNGPAAGGIKDEFEASDPFHVPPEPSKPSSGTNGK